MSVTTPPTLRAGDSGPYVQVWQLHGLAARHLLREDQVTGTMDAATVAATRIYQSGRGLAADGIVGPITWGFAGFIGDRKALRFLKTSTRRHAVRHIVIHHSVSGVPASLRPRVLQAATSQPAAADVDYAAQARVHSILLDRGLSTHYVVGPFGGVVETLDPGAFRAAHALGWNDRTVGVDVAAPLDEDASSTTDDLIWPQMGTAPWAPGSDGRRYHRDTEAAAVALDGLLRRLCARFGLPYEAPASMKYRHLDPDTAPPGVLPHGGFQANRWDGFAGLTRMQELGLGPRLV